jgi:dTMP kinase
MTDPAAEGVRQGLFISFEGTEGSGKSTQLRRLVDRLRQTGVRVTESQEPGATSIGRQIRRIFLDPANSEMHPMTELLLVFASRAQAAAEVILPALSRGEVVVSDRFTDSTLAYQGAGRRLGFEKVWELHRLALGSLLPDLTLCLTVDLEAGLSRAWLRNQRADGLSEERLDRQSLEFHRRVQQSYGEIAALEPKRFRLIDGNGTPEAVSERVWAAVASALKEHGLPAAVCS